MKRKLLKSRSLKRLLSVVLSFAMVMVYVPLSSMTVHAESLALTAVVDNSSNYTPTQIVNGGFETDPNTFDASKGTKQYKGVDGGWNTSEDGSGNQDGASAHAYDIEWAGMNGQWGISGNYGGVSNGTDYAVEMNYYNAAALYQDLTTHGGDVILWTLQHAARREGANPQTMEVQIGKPVGTTIESNGIPTGVNGSINTKIVSDTLVKFDYNEITNPEGKTYGYGNSEEYKWLSVPQLSSGNPWYTAKGIYVIPEGQDVTRFAFVSTCSSPDLGNLLDNITFSTLIGNLHAVSQSDGSVKVTGYWGDTDSSKHLEIKIGENVYEVVMSGVLHKNFAITIPTETIGSATSVEIYHEDYATAKKTVNVLTAVTADKFTFTAPSNLIPGAARSATVVAKSGVTGMGAITVYYSSDNGSTWSATAPSTAGTYKVAIDVAEGVSYSSGTKITDASWTFTLSNIDLTVVEDTNSSYTPTAIVNGNFETRPFMTFEYGGTTYSSWASNSNPADGSTITSSTPNGVNGGWNTTETQTYQGSLFEWSNNKGTYGLSSNTGYFAEMNANNPATLYQDLSTNGGDVILWTLDHGARNISEEQTMEVEVGAPDGTAPSGVGPAVNMHITEVSKATYVASGVTGTYGKANSGDLTYLDVNKNNASGWRNVKGIYIVPENQGVTRFAFKSTMTSNAACGNMLDNITFSTLIGNLHAVSQSDGSVKVIGYWGDTDSSKKLCINIGGTVIESDMSSVMHKNFAITIPASVIGLATSVEIYHEDYAVAKKIVDFKTEVSVNDFTFTAPSTLTSGAQRSATVVAKSGVTGMGAITVYYSSDNGSTWSTTAPSTPGTYKVAIDVAEGSVYSVGTKITGASWKFTISSNSDDNGAVKVPEDKQNGNFAASGIKNTEEELENAVLTDEDKAAIAAGKHINVWIEVEDITSKVSTQDKKKVKDKMPTNYKEGIYIDFTLWKQITGNDVVKITQTPNGKVKIGFTVPKELQKVGRNYKIIRIHDGVATVLDTIVDSDFNAVFETDQFSTYAVIYEDATTSITPPKTGDNDAVWYYLLLMMAGIGIMGLGVYRRNKKA